MFPAVNNGGEGLASWAHVPFLGRIPMFTSLEKAAESGEGIVSQGGPISVILTKIVNCIQWITVLYFIDIVSLVNQKTVS